MFFGIAKRDGDAEITVKMISNGYIVRANGRSENSDWVTKEIYAALHDDMEDLLKQFFDLPVD